MSVFLVILGAVLWHFFRRQILMLIGVAVFLVSIGAAVVVVGAVVPEMRQLNWRGVTAGAGVGLVLVLTVVGGWFYILGWRGRVAATEADDLERARQKAIKDRKVT